MTAKVLVALVLVATVVVDGVRYKAAAPSYRAPAPSYSAPAPSGAPRYDFSWNVQDQPSANDYGHQEARDGYDTQGSYYVQLPDGRRQLVSYTVSGDSGYLADVQYEGEAQYPQQAYGQAQYPQQAYGQAQYPQQAYGQAPAGYSYN